MARNALCLALIGCCFWLTGCGQEDRDYVEEFDAELASMTGLETDQSDKTEGKPGATVSSTQMAANPFAETSSTGASTATATATGAQLPVGTSLAFVRTLRQSLLQQIRGARQRSESNLEVQLVLQVEATQADRNLISVRYNDVKYYHEIAGQKTSFDVSTPLAQIPPEALPYRGLVDNGFSFWLGHNNQVRELLGFPEFLQRCVRYLPDTEKQGVIQAMSAGTPAEVVAQLVDESVGLLPFSRSGSSGVAVGDSWQHDRQLSQPVPMYLSSTCSLKSVENGAVNIELNGRVSGSNQRQRSGLVTGTNLNLRDGRTSGTCQIDQVTGLPVNCRIQRSLELDVAMSDGTKGRQIKEIVSTIRLANGQTTAANPPAAAPAIYGN